MSVIILETKIKASTKVCYELSLNVDLHQASASKSKEYIVGGVRSGVMKLGDVVTWRAKHFGFWQELTVQIVEAEAPIFFADEMLKGRFKSMRHEHYFIDNEGFTTMKDIFKFTSPFGILGQILNSIFLENYMRKFLIERNEVIKSVAEGSGY